MRSIAREQKEEGKLYCWQHHLREQTTAKPSIVTVMKTDDHEMCDDTSLLYAILR